MIYFDNLELLAIKLALEEWSHWLEGSGVPFIIWTDLKNPNIFAPPKVRSAFQGATALAKNPTLLVVRARGSLSRRSVGAIPPEMPVTLELVAP